MKTCKSITVLIVTVFLLLSGCKIHDNSTETDAPENFPTLKIFMTGDSTSTDDITLISDRISEYVRPFIGANVEIIYISGSYTQTLNQKMASSEQADIVYCNSYSTLCSWKEQSFIVPLDQLLTKYGKGLEGAMDPEYMDVGKIDGETYGIPCSRDMAANVGLEYRADIAEKYGIDMNSVKTFEDLTAIFEQVKQRCPDVTPVASAYMRFWDGLGNNYGVIMDYENSTSIVNLYETPEYEDYIRLIRSWQQSGYMLDRLSNSGNNFYYFRSGEIFSSFANGKPGFTTQETRVIGHDMGFIEIIPPFACTSNINGYMYSISSNSIDIEKSMQFLNLMYSDPVVANLITYGIEGKHYEFVDKENGIINFPEGVTADTSGYSTSEGWRKGNQFITYVWEGDPVDIWEQMKNFNHSAAKSTAYGFRFDSTPVQAEILRCNEIRYEYSEGLEYGLLDPDVALPEFRDRLKDAGIDVIIAEKQRQLDEWIEHGKTLGE